MLFALVFALCVCGCVHGAAVQEHKPEVPTHKLVDNVGEPPSKPLDQVMDNIEAYIRTPKQTRDSTFLSDILGGDVEEPAIQEQPSERPTYKLVGKVGSLEVRHYDPMTLVSMGNVNRDNIQTELEAKLIRDSNVNLNSLAHDDGKISEFYYQEPGGNCKFPYKWNGKWEWMCAVDGLHEWYGYSKFCYNGWARRKKCNRKDIKVGPNYLFFCHIAPQLKRKGYRPYIIQSLWYAVADQYYLGRSHLTMVGGEPFTTRFWDVETLLSLSSSNPEQVVTSYFIHPNHATQASHVQGASLTQYPSTTVLVKKLDGEEGKIEQGVGAEQLKDLLEGALDESRREGFNVTQAMLAIKDNPACRQMAREWWLM